MRTLYSCFAPVTDQIFASISYIREKVCGWCRTITKSSQAEKAYPQPLTLDEAAKYHEVIKVIRRDTDSPCQRRQIKPLIVSTRVIDRYGRVRADQKIYDGLENLVCRMFDIEDGLPLRIITRNSQPLPSVFTGNEMISWLMDYMEVEEDDALYLANILSSLGFFYPLDDRTLKVKNDSGFYRFQSPYYWRSGLADGSDHDYASYLSRKKIYSSNDMFEPLSKQESLALEKLKKKFSSIWSRIEADAIQDVNFTENYGEEEKQIIFSEQRAFWDLRRPLKGGVQKKIEFEYTKLLMFKPYLEFSELFFPLVFPIEQ